MDDRPIGIFDSGLGGLSVWRTLRKALPHESLTYFGDGLNCPYGEKNRAEIIDLTLQGVGWLVDQGCKLVVVACNTATAAGIVRVRENFDIPVVGMLPAVKPAAASTKSGKIAVLATGSSVSSAVLGEYIERFAQGTEVITAVGEEFVELVENGGEAYAAVNKIIEPLIARGVDRIVLGCTHYTFLVDVMREVIGARDIQIVDPSEAVVRRVEGLLREGELLTGSDNVAEYRFHTLAGAQYLAKIKTMASKCEGL